ncbi:pyridoxal reductase [Nannizzia gypsea CBS 118893]|uniref:Pyridoxal reductase n=1 Tax=Arthroderma gypseum (strain ATCC MYA-4604 / CBS 118893) TaxID=535722 RepID=E4V0W4_ARTGP|nr:pyridoxal reductase [Nannizzia gypsea CBS 118893]EFR03679.1 pyridoxal reductase [Nannizzia gypsea CBS 118893]
MTQLAGKDVGPIGLGLMGFTWRAKPCSQEQAFEAMHTALQHGNNLWNGAEFYGTPEYNSLVLVEQYLNMYPEDANKIVLIVKGGTDIATHGFVVDGSPENTRRSINASLAQLKGCKKLDIFAYGRRDPNIPMSMTFGVINKEYVQTGKIGGISLSEVRAETIHEAVKHTKVLAVEAELSLFSTDILENGVAAACAQYGIPIIAYSPIGRGMLTGQIKKIEDIPEDSVLRHFPRFQPGNFEINLQLVQQVEKMAQKKGCTPAQLAINWTRMIAKRPDMPTIIPTPGATTAERTKENATLIDLTDEEMAEIDATLARFTTAGDRYPSIFASNT